MTDSGMPARQATHGPIGNDRQAGPRILGEGNPMPTTPNTSTGAQHFGVNVDICGWSPRAVVSRYGSSCIVARWMWDATPYAAIAVHIDHSRERFERYHTHLRPVETEGVESRPSELSKGEAEAVAEKLDHQGIWVRSPATGAFPAIIFVRARDRGERAAAKGRRAAGRGLGDGAGSCAESRRSRRSFTTRGPGRSHLSAPDNVFIAMADQVNPAWDFFAIGPDSLVIGMNDAEDTFRVLNTATDEYAEVPRAIFGARDLAAGGEEGGVGAAAGAPIARETAGEASTQGALRYTQADVAGAHAHHTINSAAAGPIVNAVRYVDLVAPGWWLESAFAAVIAVRNDPGAAFAGPRVTPGAEYIARKEAVATRDFDASTAPMGYVSVAAGTPVKFITRAGELTYADGGPDAGVLARVGRASYTYGFVPLWAFTTEAEHVPQAARTPRHRAGTVRAFFGSAEPVDQTVSGSAEHPAAAEGEGSESSSGLD